MACCPSTRGALGLTSELCAELRRHVTSPRRQVLLYVFVRIPFGTGLPINCTKFKNLYGCSLLCTAFPHVGAPWKKKKRNSIHVPKLETASEEVSADWI